MVALANRIVAVTGANGHLGRAVSRRLAEAGAGQVLLDRKPVAGSGPRIVAKGGVDLTDAAAVAAALDEAMAEIGSIDALIATAGAFGTSPVASSDWDAFVHMLDANFRTAFACCKAAIPHLSGRDGRIVTIGARPAFSAPAGLSAYAAAKSAVMRLTESLSEELRDKGVTANCVAPSTLDTPANRAAMPDSDPSRWVSPDDLAEIILFLLSDPARAISGATIPVYGRA